ncbi:hypothetical protein RJ639_038007 [Escallonia herrerae]|uniref:DRBM domain-containing protein n=1 Tax=Escallonia herrerae TaxID=1293975 RepID=A0AA89B558_9ASTE|nr:hypothetical protein RJ639_038007 [Escallonia herrerae]
MYKSKLQELCHQQHSWNLPEYTSVKDGQDHNPRFTATVTVNGIPFQTSPDQCHRSSKEAQNQAAKLALDHFTSAKTIQHSPKWGSSASVEASSSSGKSFFHNACIPALNTTMDIKSANSGTSHPPKNENVQALQTIEALFGFNDIKTCKGFATLNTKLETGPADSGIQRPAEENVLTVHKNATSLHLQDNTRSKAPQTRGPRIRSSDEFHLNSESMRKLRAECSHLEEDVGKGTLKYSDPGRLVGNGFKEMTEENWFTAGAEGR